MSASLPLLAIGIAWHGIGWDVWHFSGGLGVPAWYARGCLLADLAIGFYVMTQSAAYGTQTKQPA